MRLGAVVHAIDEDFFGGRGVLSGLGALGAVDHEVAFVAPSLHGFGLVHRQGRERLEIRVGETADVPAIHRVFRKRYDVPHWQLEVVPSAEAQAFDTGVAVGDMVGHAARGTYGTVGGFVLSDGVPSIISNSHVLARCGYARVGDLINDADGYPVAVLTRATRLRRGTNVVDAAIAEMLGGAHPIAAGHVAVARAAPGALVIKRGAMTGVTVGRIVSVDYRVRIHTDDLGPVWFKHQIAIESANGPFSLPGDSGSMVHDFMRRDVAIGLLFAGQTSVLTPARSYANHLEHVVQALRLA